MSIPEGRMLLLDLPEFATREPFVYSHRWRVNEFVMWDKPFDNASRTAVRSERGTRYQADAAGGRRPDHLPVPKFSCSRPSCSAWGVAVASASSRGTDRGQ